MTGLLVSLGVGVGALYLWQRTRSRPSAPIYYGAPAWPTMGPQVVPDIGLPYGVQQATTYYGVSSTLLEPFLK